MSEIKDTSEAIKGILEAVPIYEDALQPAVQELSKGMLTLAKTVNMALSPLSALVWGYDRIAEYLESAMTEKLKDTPQENIVTPDPSVAGPAIEAMRFSSHNEEIRELFTNLLATAMDKTTIQYAHPSFVEILKQLSPDEAKIIAQFDGSTPLPLVKIRFYNKNEKEKKFFEALNNFSTLPFEVDCKYPLLGPSYLENIERLGLVAISYDIYNTNPGAYDNISSHSEIDKLRTQAENLDRDFNLQKGAMTITSFGKKFHESCVSKD